MKRTTWLAVVGAIAGWTLILVAAIIQVSGARSDVDGAIAAGMAFCTFGAVGLVIAVKQPRNAIGWVFLLIPFFGGLTWFSEEAARSLGKARGYDDLIVGILAWINGWSWWPTLTLIPTFPLLLFPDGRLPSPRWRWVAYLAAFSVLIGLFVFPFNPEPIELGGDGALVENPFGISAFGSIVEPTAAVAFPSVLLAALLCVVSLVFRFRSSRAEQRQQLKFLVYASCVLAVFFAAGFFFEEIGDSDVLFGVCVTSIPVSAGIAILRYRLYEIDVVINKTLVYGVLTAVLAAVYIALVFALQAVLEPVTAESDLAIAASTLAVAALFRPARTRVQGFIDRRFYRRKVDAQRTLEQFSAHLRDEVDLVALNTRLTAVVAHTLQPAHVSLWLRKEHG